LIETVLFTATSFAVGLSGALVPGPMLTVTISDSVQKGFTAGPLVVLGHFLVEIALIILILAGLGWLIGSTYAALIIGTVGGLVLVFMGYRISSSSDQLTDVSSEEKLALKYGPILGGVITSISNPYFFIWWATIGGAFMLKGLELAGIFGLIMFLVGHWSADLSWYSAVSFFSSKGSKIMTDNHYKIIMRICGVFLIVLGIYFVLTAQIDNLTLFYNSLNPM
jgi:threonine/homoserine/homoserine lactone efflux protein